MLQLRFSFVSITLLTALILHELHSENIFPAFPILAEEIGWWLIGCLLLAHIIFIERKTLTSVGLEKFTFSTIINSAIGFGLALCGIALFGMIIALSGLDPTSTEGRLNATATAPHWWLILVFLRAGIIEEFFFRGFIISRLLEFRVSPWLALTISTVLFIIPHAFFWPAPALILVAFNGLALGTIFIWKRDLFACIIAHIGINVGGVIASILTSGV